MKNLFSFVISSYGESVFFGFCWRQSLYSPDLTLQKYKLNSVLFLRIKIIVKLLVVIGLALCIVVLRRIH